jgi:hypothetical protein
MNWFAQQYQRNTRTNPPKAGRPRCRTRLSGFRPALEILESRLTPSSTPVVAASYFDSAVYELDASTGALLNTLVAPNSQSTLLGPAGMTVGPDGNLYLSSQNNDSIVEYNVATNTLSTFIGSDVLGPIAAASGDSTFAPAGLRFGPDGNLYVSLNGGQGATSSGAVVRFGIANSSGTLSYNGSETALVTGLVEPTGLAFGTAANDMDNLYVSNSGSSLSTLYSTTPHDVIRIAQATGNSPSSSIFVDTGSNGLNYPSGLTWGPDGKLYVVDLGATSGAGQVLRFNANGSFDTVFSTPATSLQFQFPSDAAFMPTGSMLVANLGATFPVAFGGPGTSGSVYAFDASGAFNQNLTSTSFPANASGVTNFSPSLLAFNAGNTAPTASAGGAYAITEGQSLVLDASGSADADGDSLTYSWVINGTYGAATGVSPTLTWPALQALGVTGDGNFAISVEVADGHGQVTTATTFLTVRPPLVAASYFDSAVYELDASTGTLLNTLVAPDSQSMLLGPAGLTVGPDGNLYLSSQNNDSIVEYNVATNTLSTFIGSDVLGPIAAASGDSTFAPAGLRFGPDGNLYVSLNGGQGATSSGAVVRFNLNNTSGTLSYGGTFTTVATGLIQPTEMTFGTAVNDFDNLYVSNSGAGTVVKINHADGNFPATSTFIAAGSGGLQYPSGLTWGPDGYLYVVDLGAASPFLGQVLRYAPDGTFDAVFTSPSTSLQAQFPSDAVFAENGNILTANLGPTFPVALGGPGTSGAISEFYSDGSFKQSLTSSSFPADPSTGVTNFSPSQLTLYLGNRAPTASAGGSYSVVEGQSLTLNAGGSSDPDGDALTFAWFVNGSFAADGSAPTLSWSQLNALGVDGTGTWNISVEVADGHGHVVTSPIAQLTTTSMAAQLSQLREQYGFYSTGDYSQNRLGLNEKWILDRSGNSYVIQTDGSLQEWLGGSNLAAPIAVVNPQVWDNPNLLLQADLSSFLSQADQNQLSALQAQYGFYTTGNFNQNFLGLSEKWIQDRTGAWWVIQTNGQLQQWLGGSSLGDAIATLNSLVWDAPNLLLQAGQ